MTASKNFLVNTSFFFITISDVFRLSFCKFENFIDFNLVLSQSSCFVKAHCLEMSGFNRFLRLSAQNVFPFESNEAEWVDNVEIDGARWWNGKSEDQQKVEENQDWLKIIVVYSHWHCAQVYQHTNDPIYQQKVDAAPKEVRSFWGTMKNFSQDSSSFWTVASVHDHGKSICWRENLWPLENPFTSVIFLELWVLLKGKLSNWDTLSSEIGLIDIYLSIDNDHITKKLFFWNEDVSRHQLCTRHLSEMTISKHINFNNDLSHLFDLPVWDVEKEVVDGSCDDGGTQE